MKLFGLGGDRQVLSLDWDARSLRVVQWQMGKGKARARKSLTAAVTADVRVRDPQSMGDFLRRVLQQEGIRTNAAIVDIPRDQAVLNTMSLPAVSVDDLAGMVQLQIAKELPFALSDAVVDFAVSDDQGGSETVDVLVAAIRNEVLDFYKSVCERAGLRLERVGLRPYANMVAVNEMLGQQGGGRVMFVDVGPRLTEIGILRDGTLVFSRAASAMLDPTLEEAPAEEGPEAGAAESADDRAQRLVKSLLVEITRSSEAYRTTDPGARFDRIVVGGSCDLEQELTTLVSKRFGVQAELYDPSALLGRRQQGGEGLAAFAAAVGLGLGHAEEGKLHFDFLHPKKPLDAAARRRRQVPLVGAVVAGIAVIGLATYFIGVYPRKAKIEQLKSEIAKLDDKLDTYQAGAGLVKKVNAWQEQQLVWPDELKAVVESFPSDARDAYIDDLKLDRRKGEITMRILARSREVVDGMRDKLIMLTRDGPGDTRLPRFKVQTGKINDKGRDPEYPTETVIYVRSARIDELDAKKGKKAG